MISICVTTARYPEGIFHYDLAQLLSPEVKNFLKIDILYNGDATLEIMLVRPEVIAGF